ncbi:MAG: HAD family hydrolase [Akkermansiaceae bacterium]
MKPLDPLSQPELLLAFDYDGTLCCPHTELDITPEFFQTIRTLREERVALWGIDTGRSLMQMVAGLTEARFPFLPDFIIAREREIYTPNNFGRWLPVNPWNKICDKAHTKLFRKSRKFLAHVQAWVESETVAVWGQQEGEPAGIVASSVEEMDGIVAWLNEQLAGYPLLDFQRNGIYMRFSHRDYHKGTALLEVAKLCGLTAQETFAIGDSHNDLDMLNREIANWIACPTNACEEVKAQVAQNGGYVASSPASQGVVESLKAAFVSEQSS